MSNFDLHFHSSYSDGKLSVPELAAIVKRKKLEYCALADHNTVNGINELIKCLDGSGIKVIPATELTAKHNDNEVHILAYDFDIDVVAEILKERNTIVRRKKIEEMKFRNKFELRINEIESIILPFKYVLIDGKPLMSEKIVNYLKSKKGF